MPGPGPVPRADERGPAGRPEGSIRARIGLACNLIGLVLLAALSVVVLLGKPARPADIRGHYANLNIGFLIASSFVIVARLTEGLADHHYPVVRWLDRGFFGLWFIWFALALLSPAAVEGGSTATTFVVATSTLTIPVAFMIVASALFCRNLRRRNAQT